jgi:hypothetical protein
MDRSPGDNWLEDNDTVARAVQASSIPAFINVVVVPEFWWLERHLLEHTIECCLMHAKLCSTLTPTKMVSAPWNWHA